MKTVMELARIVVEDLIYGIVAAVAWSYGFVKGFIKGFRNAFNKT